MNAVNSLHSQYRQFGLTLTRFCRIGFCIGSLNAFICLFIYWHSDFSTPLSCSKCDKSVIGGNCNVLYCLTEIGKLQSLSWLSIINSSGLWSTWFIITYEWQVGAYSVYWSLTGPPQMSMDGVTLWSIHLLRYIGWTKVGAITVIFCHEVMIGRPVLDRTLCGVRLCVHVARIPLLFWLKNFLKL